MGSKKFTLIELHVDGNPQFGPKRLGEAVLGGDDPEVAEDEREEASEDESGGPAKPIAAVVGLVALVGVAVAVKKLRGGDEEGADEFEPAEEPDVVVN